MRGGKWILSTCGIVGLILSAGAAHEFPFGPNGASAEEPGVVRSGDAVPSRFYSRRGIDPVSDNIDGKARQRDTATPGSAQPPPVAAPTGPPSRYTRNRRFPLDDRKSVGDSRTGARQKPSYLDKLFRGTQPSADNRAPVSATAKTLNRNARKQQIGNNDAGGSQAGDFTANDQPAVPPGTVNHADFQHAAGATTRGQIRQAAATSENVSPFSAAGDTVEAQAGVPSHRKSNSPEFSRLPLPQSAAATVNPPAKAPRKTTISLPTRAAATATVAVSTTGPQTPKITIHWIKQSDINVGQECRFQLRVTNSGKVSAKNVTIDAYFPDSVRLTKTDPAPATATDHLTWKFAELSPGQQHVVDIRMIPSERGELETTAFVRFTAAASTVFQVNEPLLAVKVDGPRKVLVGDPASQVIQVSNPGTGVATNVKLEAIIPAGLEHLQGERLSMDIGSLNPGETRVVRIALASVDGGTQVLNVQVVADGDLRETEAKTINVIAPSLSARLSGPAARYVGHAAHYTVTLNNDSDVASNNVRAVYKLPNGFKFLRADNGGRLDPAGRTASWFVGRLEPGQSVERSVYLTAVKTGAFTHSARVTSEHGASASAELATTIDATASLALQIVERDDPVKVGADTAFEVRVRNDGGKPALNVGLSIELPAGVKYQNARGPSEFLAENGLLLFKSIERLDPGKTAVYRVYIQGTTAGNHRVRARVASDSISEPLIVEELTKFHVE